MKFALFNDFQLGLVQDSRIYDIGLVLFGAEHPHPCLMKAFIDQYDSYKTNVEELIKEAPSFALSEVRLRQPVSKPGKILAAPVNYYSHQREMNLHNTARGLGFFLKANTSLIGPGDPIVLPAYKAGRRIDHELELAIVIGKKAKNVKAADAGDYLFGYTCLNDVTLRPDEQNEEERCLRKSFDTFTPMGPWIVTADEVGDAQNLEMALHVNDERRQKINTKEMVCGIGELVEIFSHVATLEPGDIIATGTPDGVAPIRRGDRVRIEIERIGVLANPVEAES
ncbi:fumarylacetoacetate hydrolase family protein [Cohnella sp. AR92]|uniref:fumarylacetoacetate hydrolase family protein n=1 Tax=Cohnella sp. AR92 TaxID=648716 RepID=UPI000F8C4AC6|nr:fumarylacetoacetate hydrolase family protein [Cohnella sp. AR92]RUS45731.1 FAA hydrolase family protein [Cohnella sp. AR92]